MFRIKEEKILYGQYSYFVSCTFVLIKRKGRFWLESMELKNKLQFFAVLRSRSRKEPHLLVGAGTVTRCGSGSGSDGSGSNNGITHS
jgi:hypothetical protein